MLGANISEVDWPQSGEIDIMEYTGKRPDTISGTLHGPGYSGPFSIGTRIRQSYQIADDFHVYAVEWDKNEINWFYEGVKYLTVRRTDVGRHKWVFDQPFFILLNLAVGGTSGGHVSKDTVFPAQYQVDYVRVFQKEE
jgi:beta-glucanase (GH16 family)